MVGNKIADICPVKGQIDRNARFNGISWQIRIKLFDENKEVQYKLKKGFLTADEANDAKEKYDSDFKRDARRYGLATEYSKDLSLKAYLEYFLEEILASYCQATTMMVYRYTLYKHILPDWKSDTMLAKVTDEELNQLLDAVAKTSKIAANKAREFLYLALRHAYYNEKRINNLPVLKKCPRPKQKVNTLNKEELRKLLDAAVKSNWYLEILLALFLGLRKGEIRGLKFSDFDDEQQTVMIQRQLSVDKEYYDSTYEKKTSKPVIKAPKTKNSVRKLHVPDYVWAEVLKRKDTIEARKNCIGEKYVDNDYVSCDELGKPRGETSINTALNKLCKRNGIKHMTVHGLRHCYASILLELGYDLPTISGLLGHSSVNTTYEMYAEVIDGNSEILTCLNELYAMDEED